MPEPFDQRAQDVALVSWLADSTGLVVIWMYESAVQPAHPYIGLYIKNVKSVSSLPEVHHTYDAEADLGEELTETHRIQDTMCLQVNVYGKLDVKPNSASGKGSALQILQKALGALGTQARASAFRAAGLAVQKYGPVQRMPQNENGIWVDRAICEVYIGIESIVTSKTGYIDTVRITGDFDTVTTGPEDVSI